MNVYCVGLYIVQETNTIYIWMKYTSRRASSCIRDIYIYMYISLIHYCIRDLLYITHTHTHSLTHTLSLSHTHTHTLSHTHTHTHIRIREVHLDV